MFQDDNHMAYDAPPDNAHINKARSNLMLSLFLLVLAVFILIFSFAIIDKEKYTRTQQVFKAEEILASKTANRHYLDDGLYKADKILPIIFHTDDNNFQFIKYHSISAGDRYVMNIPTKEIFVSDINITKFTDVFLHHLSVEININPRHWKVTFYGYVKSSKDARLYDKILYNRLSILAEYLTRRNITNEEVSIGVLPLSADSNKKDYISVHVTELENEESK